MSPVIAIVFKDIVIEMRSKESVSSMLMFGVLVLPIFVIFNNLKFNLQFLEIAGIAVLGTLAIAAIGSILSTISANTRMKEVMLPVLQIPLTVPVVIASVEATSMVLSGDTKGIS